MSIPILESSLDIITIPRALFCKRNMFLAILLLMILLVNLCISLNDYTFAIGTIASSKTIFVCN